MFQKAVAKEVSAQSIFGKLVNNATHKLMKWMIGLETPCDRNDSSL